MVMNQRMKDQSNVDDQIATLKRKNQELEDTIVQLKVENQNIKSDKAALNSHN